MKKGLILYTTLFFFLAGVIYVTATLSSGRTAFFGKASTPGLVKLESCRVFSSPVIAKAGGGEQIRVTVFVLDEVGKGVPGKNVSLNCKELTVCQNAGISFNQIQPNTGEKGEAYIDVSSPVQGKFELQASVGGLAIPQTVTVVFQ